MKFVKWLALFTLAVSGVAFATPRESMAANSLGLLVPYEVKVDDGVNPASHAAMFLEDIGIPEDEQVGRIGHVYQYVFPGYSIWLTEDEYEKAERIALGDGDIEVFVPSFEASAGPVAVSGVGPLDEQIEPLALTRLGMPTGVYDYSSQPVVAVLDTGVDATHPDLNVAPGFNGVEPGKEIRDVVGHGTFVSGVIGALDNDIGIRGAAPGATIIPVKGLGDDGFGSTADIIAGIDYLAGLVLSGQRVDVLNMSLGGANPEITECDGTDLFHTAVCALVALDVVVVVSAGNSGGPSIRQSPANYPEVVTVSAFADADGEPGGRGIMPEAPCSVGSADDALATFSSFGENVDITAVGVCNVGTSPTTWESPVLSPFDPYGSGSGTSFSAPLVSGAVARYRADNPDQPGRVAVEQLLRYSTLYGGSFTGDPDGVAEPVLWLGDIPRWGN